MQPITRPPMNYPADMEFRPDMPIESTDTATTGTKVNNSISFAKCSFDSIMETIRSNVHQKRIEAIRNAPTAEIAKKMKFALPWFSLNRFRNSRRNVNLSQANGIVLDYDHIDNAEELKRKIIPTLDWVRFAFISPSGNGLKVGIQFSQPLFREPDYKMVYLYLQQKLDGLLGIKSDATPDPARATFYSWDPALYDNPSAIKIDTEEILNTVISEEVQKVSQTVTQNKQSGNAKGNVNTLASSVLSTDEATVDTNNKKIIITDQVLSDVTACVSFLIKIKIEYYDWIKIGMALYSGLGEAGKKFWDMFYNNPHYYYETQMNLDKHWKSFAQVRNISLASLFYVAEQYGWKNPNPPSAPAPAVSVVLNDVGTGILNDVGTGVSPVPRQAGTHVSTMQGTHVATMQAGMTEKPSPLSPNTKKLEDYPELMELFGRPVNVELDASKLPVLLQDYLRFTQAITDAQAGARLTSILPAIACNIGNRVYMVNNSSRIYCNIWGIIIGPSSISRKTTVIKLAKQTLEPYEERVSDAESEEYLKNTLILTDVTMSMLLSMLAESPNRVFIQMEISAWMRLMNRQWNAGMKQALTDLFDGVDKTIANRDRTERIRKPAFSVIAASTEGWFYQELKDVADQQSGFLQRFIYCLIQDVNTEDIDTSYREGQETCPELRDFEQIYSVFRSIPGNFKLIMSTEAKEYRDDVYKKFFSVIVKTKNDLLLSYFARIFDGYFFKFCIIFTMLDNWERLKADIENKTVQQFFKDITVTIEITEQAMTLCIYYFENTKPLLNNLSENSKLMNERKLIALLCRYARGTASHSQLLNRSHMNKREFKDAIDSLIERNAVTVTTQPSKNQYLAKTYLISKDILESWEANNRE